MNLLVVSDLTLDCYFKVKLGQVRIKGPIACLLLVVEVSNVRKNIGCKSFGGVRFDLGPLLQVQIRAGQHKSAFILLISGSRGLQYTVNL